MKLLVVTLLLSWQIGLVGAAEQVSFSKQVLPILSDKCFICHGPDAREANALRLDSWEGATVDLGGYRAIDAAAPESSELLHRIRSQDDPMPPQDAEKQLTDVERETLAAWIEQGGKYTKHWAYVRPEKSLPLSASDATGSAIIDGFIRDQLPAANASAPDESATGHIDLAPAADRATLARRVALVLTGLPPTPQQLSKYLSTADPEAYETLVEDLLQDPKFGEHQARYWLDAVRYGDTHGLHLDNRRAIYPYRDWVVKALNDNLHFDQFITWQLAGDLLPNPTLEQLVATGYVRLNPSTSEGGAITEEFQAKNSFDRAENFGTVFLGMSLTCARCHTHKYDPILHSEYYQILAFFNNTSERALDGNKYDYAPILQAPNNQTQWKLWSELTERESFLLDRAAELIEQKTIFNAEQERAWEMASPREKLQLLAVPNSLFGDSTIAERAQDLLAEWSSAESNWVPTLVAQELEQRRPTYLLSRGEYDLPTGEPLIPDTQAVLSPFPSDAPRNRLGLAQWMVHRDNPLVSRVLINRVWQRVFGIGLVRTPEEFGLQGQQPTHPELLDWLAVEFQESGWDLKHMLRLMVHSKTFQQSSSRRSDISDPENRLFARGPSFRLDAEILRDLALWGSGLMIEELGGEGIKPFQPDGLWEALSHPASNTKNYVPDTGDKLYRRSLYVYWKRTSPHPMMTLFDAPSRESSCVARSRTSTSLQSLALFNETQRIEFARKFAERLMIESPPAAGATADGKAIERQRLDALFVKLVCRPATVAEAAACLNLLQQMNKRYATSDADCQALLAIGKSPVEQQLDAVELAAWTQVVVTVLASDPVILLY